MSENNEKIQNSSISITHVNVDSNTVVFNNAGVTMTVSEEPSLKQLVNHQNDISINLCAEIAAGAEATAEMQKADASYELLRATISKKVTEALQSGKTLVQEKAAYGDKPGDNIVSYGPVNFSDWHLALPASQHQHYNCDYCKNVWSYLAGLGVMDENGKITYPVLEALREIEGVDEVAKKALEQRSERQRPSYMPIYGLPSTRLEKQIVGGFGHFYGVEDAALVDEFNGKHVPFADIKYVDHLFQQIIAQELNVDLLAKVFVYVKANIGEQEHTALGRSDDLIKLITDVRRVQKESRNGPLYLWSLLQVKSNSWMHHINGSVLGIVLDVVLELKDSEDMAGVLTSVKALLAKATSAVNYKQKTAEAPQAAVEQAVKFLTERGLRSTLERRLLPLSEANQIVWKAGSAVVEDTSAEAAQPTSALDVAFGELTKEKSPELKTAAKMDDILGDVEVRKTVSLEEFVRLLPTFKSLSILSDTAMAMPVFATAAAGDGDHAQLLKFIDGLHDTSLLLGIPQPCQYHYVAQLSNVPSPYVGPIEVSAVLRTKSQFGDNDDGYILNVEGFAARFYETLRVNGTCILGTNICSEHFGMSRALVELSRKIPMNVDAGDQAVGGVLANTGMTVLAKLQDGTSQRITITSRK